MKKVTLLTTATLAILGLCGQPLTAQAACNIQNGNMIIYAYGSNCNIQGILDNLGNCFPGMELPEINCPETDAPEMETPEVNIPETESPKPETPEVNVPETESPKPETPEVNGPESDSSENSTHAYIQEVVNLVNAERAKEGLSPLTIDVKVQAAAQVRAKECEQNFSHTRPNGSSFSTALTEQNVSYRNAGENIAWGQRSPKDVMNAWMNSAGHRANIMNPSFTTIGVGYYQNANGTNYWCQLFTR